MDKEVGIEKAGGDVLPKAGDGSDGTPHNTSCCSKGHICFDCFPIPDELLDQLHCQTGMSKLICLQAAQTVVRFYKNDLTCSSFYACGEGVEIDKSGYSEEMDESALLFTTTTPPVTTMKMSSRGEISQPKTSKTILKLSGADQFRNLIQRLKLEPSNSWTSSQNISFVFTFFRKLNKVAALMLLTDEDFKAMGIEMGPRRKLLKAINDRQAALESPGEVIDNRL